MILPREISGKLRQIFETAIYWEGFHLFRGEIQHAIVHEDLAAIKAVKGIGLKTAQRVLIELKDKIQNVFGMEEISATKNNTIKEETLSALEVLGYPRRQAEKVIDNIIQSAPESSVEELIKQALNKL